LAALTLSIAFPKVLAAASTSISYGAATIGSETRYMICSKLRAAPFQAGFPASRWARW
jgi:hypothetical protein